MESSRNRSAIRLSLRKGCTTLSQVGASSRKGALALAAVELERWTTCPRGTEVLSGLGSTAYSLAALNSRLCTSGRRGAEVFLRFRQHCRSLAEDVAGCWKGCRTLAAAVLSSLYIVTTKSQIKNEKD